MNSLLQYAPVIHPLQSNHPVKVAVCGMLCMLSLQSFLEWNQMTNIILDEDTLLNLICLIRLPMTGCFFMAVCLYYRQKCFIIGKNIWIYNRGSLWSYSSIVSHSQNTTMLPAFNFCKFFSSMQPARYDTCNEAMKVIGGQWLLSMGSVLDWVSQPNHEQIAITKTLENYPVIV